MTADEHLDVSAAEPLDAQDERILQALALMYAESDPVPAGLVDQVTFGLTLDALEAEIAHLQRLELSTSGARAERSSDEIEVKTVTFSADSRELMVTITPDGLDTVRIDGWISPGAGADVALRLSSGERSTTADEDGRFVVEDVPRGLAKFIIRGPDGGPDGAVITPSIEI